MFWEQIKEVIINIMHPLSRYTSKRTATCNPSLLTTKYTRVNLVEGIKLGKKITCHQVLNQVDE
jgi:hypothetical protein